MELPAGDDAAAAAKPEDTSAGDRRDAGELSPLMRQLIESFTEVYHEQALDRAALARRPLGTP